MPYYKGLSKNNQLIISTHSPFIINSADDNDRVIILKRKDDNQIDSTSDEYYGLSEIKKISHKMNIIPDPNKLKLVVAGKTDKQYLEHVIEKFKSEYYIFKNIEIIYPFGDDNGGYGGNESLISFNRGSIFMHQTKYIWFIYDSDLKPNQKEQISSFENKYIFKKVEMKILDAKKIQV